MVKRSLNPLKSKSFFLFGTRATGKSTFVLEQFLNKNTNFIYLNLLDPVLEDRLRKNPLEINDMIEDQNPDWVFIDEVQTS